VGADAFAPLIRRASAVLQPHRVQPLKAAGHRAGGRVPATSRVPVYETDPRAPHPAPSSARLRKTPLVRAGREDYKHGQRIAVNSPRQKYLRLGHKRSLSNACA
jgi:hypothetical protein